MRKLGLSSLTELVNNQKAGTQLFSFDSIPSAKTKYIKIEIKSSHGGPKVYMNQVMLYDYLPEDNVSSLSKNEKLYTIKTEITNRLFNDRFFEEEESQHPPEEYNVTKVNRSRLSSKSSINKGRLASSFEIKSIIENKEAKEPVDDQRDASFNKLSDKLKDMEDFMMKIKHERQPSFEERKVERKVNIKPRFAEFNYEEKIPRFNFQEKSELERRIVAIEERLEEQDEKINVLFDNFECVLEAHRKAEKRTERQGNDFFTIKSLEDSELYEKKRDCEYKIDQLNSPTSEEAEERTLSKYDRMMQITEKLQSKLKEKQMKLSELNREAASIRKDRKYYG